MPVLFQDSTTALDETAGELSQMSACHVVSEMDDAVGTIYRAQQALGATRSANTVIIFSSDNGAPPAGSGPMGTDHSTDAEGKPCNSLAGCPNSGTEWLARNYPFR